MTMVDPPHWSEAVDQLATLAGVATVTVADVQATVAQVVPDYYRAHTTGDYRLLQGRVSDNVLADQEHLAGAYRGVVPERVDLDVAGASIDQGVPRLRVLLAIHGSDTTWGPRVDRQAWDLTPHGTVHVTADRCSTCGAPLDPGAVRCRYCGASMVGQSDLTTTSLLVIRIATN